MEKTRVHKSEYFYGNKISDYGIKSGYLDYGTLAKSFDAVLVNDITKLFYNTIGGEYVELELINGYIDNSEEIEELKEQLEEIEDKKIELMYIDSESKEYKKLQAAADEITDKIDTLEYQQDEPPEIYQYFIISANGAEILSEYTNDPIYYIDTLDMYIWGVTHFGTMWSGVLTDVKLELNEETE